MKTLGYLFFLFSLGSLSTQAETEFKIRLNEKSFFEVLEKLKIESGDREIKGKEQENHYFDTKNFKLKGNGINLRIRLKGKTGIITAKNDPNSRIDPHYDACSSKGKVASNLSQKEEYECNFDNSRNFSHMFFDYPGLIFMAKPPFCKQISSEGPHPVGFIEDVLDGNVQDQTLFGIKGKIGQNMIRKRGHNKTFRSVFPLNWEGQDLKAELDLTLFPNSYLGFEFELEIKEGIGLDVQNRIEDRIKELLGLSSNYNLKNMGSIYGKTCTTINIMTGKRGEVNFLKKIGQISKYPNDKKYNGLKKRIKDLINQ